MQFDFILGLAAAFASVTAAEEASPRAKLKYDETADWYRDHQMPVPAVASQVTVIEEKKSYVVKLECPDCPFYVKNEPNQSCSWEGLAPCQWRDDRLSALLLKFEVGQVAIAIDTLHVNGASVLPLGPMPLFINAYQVADNLTQETLDSIIQAGMLDAEYKGDTDYSITPALQYEHALLRTQTPGEWYVQFDVTGMQYGVYPDPLHFALDRRLVQILVKEQRTGKEGGLLSIEDIQVIERSERAQPIQMKCGKLAMVKTSFDPNEWDKYGLVGTWSWFWNMVAVNVHQYYFDNIQHNALVLPLALTAAFVIFFVRVWYLRRQQDKTLDAEYALLDCGHDELPPAYTNIPVIKIEDYE